MYEQRHHLTLFVGPDLEGDEADLLRARSGRGRGAAHSKRSPRTSTRTPGPVAEVMDETLTDFLRRSPGREASVYCDVLAETVTKSRAQPGSKNVDGPWMVVVSSFWPFDGAAGPPPGPGS